MKLIWETKNSYNLLFFPTFIGILNKIRKTVSVINKTIIYVLGPTNDTRSKGPGGLTFDQTSHFWKSLALQRCYLYSPWQYNIKILASFNHGIVSY